MTLGVCRVCGCTDNDPCLVSDGGTVVTEEIVTSWTDEQIATFSGGACYWVEPDLCSGCVDHPHPAPLLFDNAGRPLRGAP